MKNKGFAGIGIFLLALAILSSVLTVLIEQNLINFILPLLNFDHNIHMASQDIFSATNITSIIVLTGLEFIMLGIFLFILPDIVFYMPWALAVCEITYMTFWGNDIFNSLPLEAKFVIGGISVVATVVSSYLVLIVLMIFGSE